MKTTVEAHQTEPAGIELYLNCNLLVNFTKIIWL